MNRFVIVDGLPYLVADGKTYAVRWDADGFTVGAEVTLASVPDMVYSELSIFAKCAGHMDSISTMEAEADQQEDTAAVEANQQDSGEKKKAGRKKKAVTADDNDR